MLRKTLFLILLCAVVGAVGEAPRADDSDIFMFGNTVEPNVVILIDTSGSMNDTIGGVSKITIAKNVVTDLISQVNGVNFGIFAFRKGGGKLVAPIGSDKTTMIAAVKALTADGSTPLGGATGDIREYFQAYYAGTSTEPDFCESDDEGDDTKKDKKDKKGEPKEPCEALAAPIVYECQLSYAILMTDGMPTGESTNLVVDEATLLQNNDHSSFPGLQNVTVHTVGFDVPEGAALLTEAATKGGGKFYTANNATTLHAALSNAISQVVEDNFSFTQPLIPSTSVTGGSKAYMASFRPNAVKPFWSGNLRAFTRDSNGRIPLDSDGAPLTSALAWDAAAALNARSAASRNITTVISGTQKSFTTASTLTPALLNVATKAERDKLISFIRGVDSYDEDADGNVTEDRAAKLGDIFHSAPVLVFPPPRQTSDESYKAFQQANASRQTIVLAGANDGMLHAFRESDGDELWAFIPPDLLGSLKNLSPAVGAHPYFVDGSPIVADIKIGGAWKTIVIFGERRGGAYYHALDITDTTTPVYLWSFTDSKIDETWSEPALGKIRVAGGGEKYVAFVGGGYNTENNNAHGKALFTIDLATGQKLWQYSNADTGDGQSMNFSIPAAPIALDLDRDGFIDRLYVGDVGGQLWKFDTSAAATLSSGLVTNWTGKRLFAAVVSQANPPPAGEFYPAQAFYGTPVPAFDSAGDLWVFIGSGDRNHPNRASSNRLYGIKDTTTMANGSTLTESDLVSATTTDVPVHGWYYTLAANEKTLSSAEVFNRTAYFATFTPNTVATCGSSGGSGRVYAMKTASGHAAIDWPSGNELATTDGSENRSDSVGDGIPADPDVVLGDTTDSLIVATTDEEVSDDTLPRTRTKRVRYWREVMEAGEVADEEVPTEGYPDSTPNHGTGGIQ